MPPKKAAFAKKDGIQTKLNMRSTKAAPVEVCQALRWTSCHIVWETREMQRLSDGGGFAHCGVAWD